MKTAKKQRELLKWAEVTQLSVLRLMFMYRITGTVKWHHIPSMTIVSPLCHYFFQAIKIAITASRNIINK